MVNPLPATRLQLDAKEKGITNTTRDGANIYVTPAYSGSSQTNYVEHPAFKFGTTELEGIWVAKFETSGTSTSLASKPNVNPYKSITIGNMFNYSRNMETNNIYRIRNIKTNKWWEGQAASARDACALAGWNFTDCEIKYKTKSVNGYSGWTKWREE